MTHGNIPDGLRQFAPKLQGLRLLGKTGGSSGPEARQRWQGLLNLDITFVDNLLGAGLGLLRSLREAAHGRHLDGLRVRRAYHGHDTIPLAGSGLPGLVEPLRISPLDQLWRLQILDHLRIRHGGCGRRCLAGGE